MNGDNMGPFNTDHLNTVCCAPDPDQQARLVINFKTPTFESNSFLIFINNLCTEAPSAQNLRFDRALCPVLRLKLSLRKIKSTPFTVRFFFSLLFLPEETKFVRIPTR